MPRHPVLAALIAGYILWGAWHWFTNRPVTPPDGILAPADPVQVDVPSGAHERYGKWTLTVRAHYQITARILSLEKYHWDGMASLVPEDLALGWGVMSDSRALRSVEISQGNRFYYWRTSANGPLSREAIIVHSANTHVIPADPLVARELGHLRPGETVTLTGDLVDGVRDDGATVHTSMTRTDTGPGACEVMLVRDVDVAHYP